MAESAKPPEQADAPLAPRVAPADWEIVLDDAAREPGRAAQPAAAGTANWPLWLRAALPLLVLAAYGVYKFAGRTPRRPGAAEIAPAISISGVAPDAEKVRLDEQTRAFVARLESLRERDDWRGILAAVTGAEPPALRAHPVVEAFDVLARVRLGERGGALALRIKDLKPRFRNDRDRAALHEALILAEARLHLDAARTPESCARYADFFRSAILAQSANTAEVAAFRVELAQAYENVAKSEVEAAGGFRPDRVKLAEARTLYQHALRWVTTPEGWLQLQPIAAGNAAVVLNRLKVQLQEANKKYNGLAAPWGESDRTTWTGKKGDPIHDQPGGRW